MENSGLVPLIKFENYEDIGIMYDLFKMIPESFELLKRAVQAYIVQNGEALVKDQNLKHEQFVSQLIEMRTKINQLLSKSFKDD